MDIKNLKPQSGRMLNANGQFIDLDEDRQYKNNQIKRMQNNNIGIMKNSEFITMPEGDYQVRWLDKDGTVYISNSNGRLEKSADWGKTWNKIMDFSNVGVNRIDNVLKLDSGELIIAGKYPSIYPTKIIKISADETDIREVHTFEEGQSYVYPEFGFSHFGDIIIAASYGDQPALKELVVWASHDRGENWTKVFSAPQEMEVNGKHKHVHDAKYDPYENILWVCVGDDYDDPHTASYIYWSNDWGKTWEVAFGYRSTQVIPLPECVLFLSDERRVRGAFRYDRPLEGTGSVNLKWDGIENNKETWVSQRMPWQATATHWGTNAAIVYGENARAYFGFRSTTSGTGESAATVWGTTDGIRFNSIWSLGRLSKNENGIDEAEILGVYGPDKNNNIVVNLSADVGNSREHQLLRIQL